MRAFQRFLWSVRGGFLWSRESGSLIRMRVKQVWLTYGGPEVAVEVEDRGWTLAAA